jgi:type VI secretion system protein ImpC
VHKKNSDFAAFIGAQSLQKPAEYDDPDATANANLSARLPTFSRSVVSRIT